MNSMLFQLKATIRLVLNLVTKYFLFCKLMFDSISYKHRKNKIRVAILADYLDCSFLFDSSELSEYDVGFISTKRYPFFTFLLNGRWKRLAFLHQCQDFGESSYEHLLHYCEVNDIQYVFIQAGDFLVPAYNYLNSHLNNKGNSEMAVRCSLNKDYMRDCLNNNNVSFVPKKTISNPGDFGEIDFYPCVLKPSISTGSEGVIMVNSPAEMQQALLRSKNETRDTDFEASFLVEQYIEGRQYDVEGILVNGKLEILCIVAENYSGFFPCFNINWFLFNAEIEDDTVDDIKSVLQSAFNVCGLKHGAYHCELKVCDNGEIKIIEFSNRMGGGFEPSISRVTGNHFADLYVRSMLGKEIVINKNKRHYLLEKYFRTMEELDLWASYMKKNNIEYSCKPWVTRGQVALMRIWHTEPDVIKQITTKFSIK